MKRCPKCNRSYQTDTQKFCTHDGGLLFAIDPDLGETVQFDSAKVQDAVSKPTTRDLAAPKPPDFDPEATVVSSSAPDEGTREVRRRDTQDLEPPQSTQQISAQAAPPTSAPLPPAQTSGSGQIPPSSSAPFDPAQTYASGPTSTSAPLPAPPVAHAQPSQPLPAPRPAKKSKLPLILGILAVFFVLGIAVVIAAYLLLISPMLNERRAVSPTQSEPVRNNPSLPGTTGTPSEVSKPANEVAPYVPPPDAVRFVNSQENLPSRLRENYVDFSFYYPESWSKVPSADNFIKVERRLPPDFTQENFAVSTWYSPEESTATDDAFFGKLVEKDDAAFAKRFSEYRKISEGPTKVGAYDAYEFRFEATSRGTDKGDVTLWGREIFFAPRPGEKAGLKFLILTTSLAPELKTAEDLGVKGELPMLLESFRFGKN